MSLVIMKKCFFFGMMQTIRNLRIQKNGERTAKAFMKVLDRRFNPGPFARTLARMYLILLH